MNETPACGEQPTLVVVNGRNRPYCAGDRVLANVDQPSAVVQGVAIDAPGEDVDMEQLGATSIPSSAFTQYVLMRRACDRGAGRHSNNFFAAMMALIAVGQPE